MLVEGFSWALAGYSVFDIKRAFQAYIKENADIPAPANIIKIIKEFKEYDGIELPDVEKLREYNRRGIPLTPKQQAMMGAV